MLTTLFTEKYRPTNLDDLVIPDRIHTFFKKGVQTNLLLYGSPGTGKTSTSKAICKHFGNEYLYINASLEGRVDVIRNQIESFSRAFSLIPNSSNPNGDKKFKVVILDEVDGASSQFFDSLKGFIEKTHATTRFIMTTNYINKIPDAIKSRFNGGMCFDFEKDEEKELIKKFLARVKDILHAEGIFVKGLSYDGVKSTEGWDAKALVELIKRKYPDFRSILTTINAFVIEGKTEITVEDIKKGYSVHKDIFDLILGVPDPHKNYQYIVSNYSRDVDQVFSSLNGEFIEYLNSNRANAAKFIPAIAINVAKYSYESKFVNDPIVSLLACIFELQNILKAG